MSEQSYETSSPVPSLFSIDLLEEYNDKISNNDELEHMFNEIPDNTSDIYFEDFEQDEVIDDSEHTEFTPCVVIDFIKGEIKRCGELTKLRQLRNLFGT